MVVDSVVVVDTTGSLQWMVWPPLLAECFQQLGLETTDRLVVVLKVSLCGASHNKSTAQLRL